MTRDEASESKMGKWILRSMAVDALIKYRDSLPIPVEDYCKGFNDGLSHAINYMYLVPSAQLEIIRCKDCKYLRKWRSEESAKKFGQIYECARNVLDCPKPEDFCSMAERRTYE